jgi:hypothetical protein
MPKNASPKTRVLPIFLERAVQDHRQQQETAKTRMPKRFALNGEHPTGDIDFSYILFAFSVRLGLAGEPIRR